MTQHVSHYHSDQIRELHAEIERLTALVAQQSRKHDADMQAMQLAHNREIERLRLKVPDRDKLLSEIEQLRAALQRILDATVDGDEMAAVEMAQRALELKP